MGKATIIGLVKGNTNEDNKYEQIFAGCYDPEASLASYKDELTEEQIEYITLVKSEVINNAVTNAAHIIQEWINQNKKTCGLVGLVQFHGVAFNGPSAYMPIDMYNRQIDVNFIGTIRIVQAFLPMLRKSSKMPTDTALESF